MTSYLSYLNPFAYSFSNEWLPGYGRSAPSVQIIKKTIMSPKFVNVSDQELQNAIKALKPIPPKAPPFPNWLIIFPAENCKEEIELFKDMPLKEIFEKLKN